MSDFRQEVGELNQAVGRLYQQGKYKEALAAATGALRLAREQLGKDHPATATSLSNLGFLLHSMGDSAGARPYLEQALAIRRAALGENHPDTARSLNNLGALYVATNRVDEAWRLMQQAAASDDRMIGQVFSCGSESQRADFLKTLQGQLDLILSLVLQYLGHSPTAVRATLDLVLRRKALGAEALAAQRDAVLGGRYPELGHHLRELSSLRMQIAQKTLAGPGPEGPQAHRQLLAQWNAQKQRLEAELARQIPEMNLAQKLHAADRRAVALALSEGGALVEFVRFNLFDFRAVPARGEPQWQPARYLAFILPGQEPDNIQMIDLGEAGPIDRLIADFRAGVTGEAGGRAGGDLKLRRHAEPLASGAEPWGLALRAAVFDPLASALGGRTRLLLAPDGDLNRVPFEVLPGSDARLLIEQYRISYLGSGRDVLRFEVASSGQPTDPLVLADPDFDFNSESRAPVEPVLSHSGTGFWSRWFGRRTTTPSAAPRPTPMAVEPVGGRGRRSRDLTSSQYHFGRLPGTRAEGERIAGLLGVQPWMDADALEARLKARRSPRILHLATHGFFLQDQDDDPDRAFGHFGGMSGAGRLTGPLPENPLLRSGLALVGANTWLGQGTLPAEAEDGLLTAEDVSGLDLLDTELVVLSACETGLGEIRTGEGVFGLRRAFVLAGAKTLVMSLWKVPDEQTRELMEDFYRRILAGEGRADALRGAQVAMKAKYPDPLYWGAFICQGDPAPLGAPGHPPRPGSSKPRETVSQGN